ncbi:cytoskeleton-associated protein 4 [Callorhinchus milii]|uniref:cytoskeleton-associated protein 4 n=1 Tax=Callorhinchus milii TaxID=7868 RepID=UPI00045763E6|nr:cytoskeleton-associated protein 4 [Callorhinchus milii]|eukprot:gi/632978431/ref/XP_007905912.1/ PREDICTED: cytoskeleton-associated protein 4 [Callorhinchus milii]
MTSVKQRNKINSDRSSSASHDDVAKKSWKGSKGGSGWCSVVGKVLTFLFFLALSGAAGMFGWYMHNLSEQINHLNRRHEETSLQSNELATKVKGVLVQVDSFKVTINRFDIMLHDTQHELKETIKALTKGEHETNRIGETLQKLQNEILRDLSDGIQDVKDARERDFISLEKTVEERLIELTKSIHDNIAVFTEVQGKCQNDIDEIKSKITSLKTTVEIKGQEITSLTQKYADLKNTLYSQQITHGILQQSVSEIQVSVAAASEEIQDRTKDLQKIKNSINEQEQIMLSKNNDISVNLEKNSESFEAKLTVIEENIMALNTAATHLSEKIEYIDASSVERTMRSVAETQVSLTGDIKVLKANLNDLQSLMTDKSLNDLQREMQALEKHHTQQIKEIQSENEEKFKQLEANISKVETKNENLAAVLQSVEEIIQTEVEGKFSLMETSMDKLNSSISEAKVDLQMLRTAVDNLLSYSPKIETSENELASLKISMNELILNVNKLSDSIDSIK